MLNILDCDLGDILNHKVCKSGRTLFPSPFFNELSWWPARPCKLLIAIF